MKKIKQIPKKQDKTNLALFKADNKSARITIDSNIANIYKFNELFTLLDNTQNLKNKISLFCFNKLSCLVTDYHQFLTNYFQFTSNNLNSWEVQNIFQDIASHYHESSTRYLDKAKFIVNSYKSKDENTLSQLASLVYKNTNLKISDTSTLIKPLRKAQLTRLSPSVIERYNLNLTKPIYELDLDIMSKLINLNSYLDKYNDELNELNKLDSPDKDNNKTDLKQIKSLNNLINKYKKLISSYSYIESLKTTKPIIYNRFVELITQKKLRLLKQVKLG